MKTIYSARLASLLLLALTCVETGCHPSRPANPTTQGASLLTGDAAFSFNPKDVIDLTLRKFEPEYGTVWTAAFKNENTHWTITASPNGQAILDHIADDVFINHLIDTLRYIKLRENPKNGPLTSFGLANPRFALQWQTRDKPMQLSIGDAVPGEGGTFYVSLQKTEGQNQTYLATGSAFAILNQIKSFDSFRKPVWTTLDPDEIDEIQFLKRGKLFFFAQREGDVWTNQKHKPLDADIDSVLEKLTRTRFETMIEDPIQKKRILDTRFQDPTIVQLIGRNGTKHILRFKINGETVFGLNSSRPDGLFVLPKPIREALKPNA